VHLFGAIDLIRNPFTSGGTSLAGSGTVEFTAIQLADVIFLYPGLSFSTASLTVPAPFMAEAQEPAKGKR
jgi:hypothetical protein